MRVKSLTPPLPSVFPITAMTWSAVNFPLPIRSSTPLASCTVLSSTFATSIAIGHILRCRISLSHSRQVLAAQHLFISVPAVNHRQRALARLAQIASPQQRRRLVDPGLFGGTILCEHHAIIGAGACDGDPPLDHVAQDQ